MANTKHLRINDGNNDFACWLNDDLQLYIEVGEINSEFPNTRGYVTLDKDDVKELIKELKSLEKQM